MIINTSARLIIIPEEIVNKLLSYIQFNSLQSESGGILIGKENIENDNIIITDITEPFCEDKCSLFSFERKDKQHIDFFNKIYEKYDGRIRYYGEWHTHYEKIPHYSSIDMKNWNKIYNNDPCRRMYIHLIVGQNAITLYYMIDINNIEEYVIKF